MIMNFGDDKVEMDSASRWPVHGMSCHVCQLFQSVDKSSSLIFVKSKYGFHHRANQDLILFDNLCENMSVQSQP